MSMRPVSIDLVGAVTSQPIPMEWRETPVNITIQVSVVTGLINVTVQYTNDDIRREGWDPATANWFDHADLTAVAALADGTIISPVRAIRATNAAAGTARVDIVSASRGG